MTSFDGYYAERWGKAKLTKALGPSKKMRLSILLEYIKGLGGEVRLKRFLDYGCGSGWLYQHLKHLNFDEHHIYDVTPSVVQTVKEMFPMVVPWAGTGDLPSAVPSANFDLVASIEVLEHVPFAKKKDFLLDVHRVLKPGGYYFLTTPNANFKRVALLPGQSQPVEDWTSMSETKRLLTESGFVIVDYGSWYFQRKFSRVHSLFFSVRLSAWLERFGLKASFHKALGRFGLGLSMFFWCRTADPK